MIYDAIIIGSGLGGLTTASFLARNGKKVIVLERHNVPGGFTHTFKRKGYEWDVGVHYVGQVGDEKAPMRKLFDYITDDKLKWSSMGEVYDRVIIEGQTYDFVAGYEKQMAKIISYFPDEEKAIRKYFKLINGFGWSSGLFFGERSMPSFVSFIFGSIMRWRFKRRAERTTYEVLRQLTENEKLISVLCAQCGDYGLPPKKSSFAIHAGLANHYLNGGNYPVGGAKSIYERLIEGIESRGGEILLNADVEEVMVENGKAVGVFLKDGRKFSSKVVVSNAGARNTFKKLWPRNTPLSNLIDQGLNSIKPSLSHVCLYIGLKASDEELNLPKNNFWLYDSYEFDREFEKRRKDSASELLMTYISFPSAKDPEWKLKHPHRATIQVIAPCPYEWVEAWEDQEWMKREEDYLNYKATWEKKLLAKALEVVPQIKDFIDHCEVSTPLSTRHFSNYQSGEIYGLEHTPERMKARWLRAHTPIKNFFMTGQDIVMVGVGGALFSGVLTSVAVLKKNVMWPVLRKS